MLLSEDFQIDWLEFKIKNIDNITSLAKRLLRLNFNVYLKRKPDFIPKLIYTKPKNNDRVNLTVYYYQSSKMLRVEFLGKSAQQAYSLMKQNKFHEKLFDLNQTLI